MLRGHRERAIETIRRASSSSSQQYFEAKIQALEAVVAVSARFQEKYSFKQRLRLLVTQSKYGKPAITALGIGIFQQLCGFNSLSEWRVASGWHQSRVLYMKQN